MDKSTQKKDDQKEDLTVSIEAASHIFDARRNTFVWEKEISKKIKMNGVQKNIYAYSEFRQ